MIRRLVLSCGCFDSEKMLKKEPNKKPQLEWFYTIWSIWKSKQIELLDDFVFPGHFEFR